MRSITGRRPAECGEDHGTLADRGARKSMVNRLRIKGFGHMP